MRSIRSASAFGVALSALALLAAAAGAPGAGATPTRAASVPGCLTLTQAARALEAPYADELPGNIGDPSTCAYFPVYHDSVKREIALLTIAIYARGLPGWARLAKAACELDNDACPYAKFLTKERDPLRYMHLLYAALTKATDGTVGELGGYLPGSVSAFFWNQESPGHGTYVLMYVAERHRFVSLNCSRGPERLYPHGWFENCALAAARFVYINLAT
jgi:hypothetical protein